MPTLNKGAGVIIAFGRLNPPTTGHAKLVAFLRQEAAKRDADVIVFPTQSHDAVKNPLPFREKVAFLKALFPVVAFNENEAIRTIFDALYMLSLKYDRVWVVVGSDRLAEFENLGKYVRPRGRRAGKYIILQEYGVIAVPGNRDPDSDDVAGMSASKMRAAAIANDWSAFRAGVPTTNEALAKKLYASVRKHMGLTETRLVPKAAFLCDLHPHVTEQVLRTIPRPVVSPQDLLQVTTRTRNIFEMRDTFVVDVSGCSTVDIQTMHSLLESVGYETTIYLSGEQLRGPVTEARVTQLSTRGTLLQSRALRTVMLERSKDVIEHLKTMLREEPGKMGPPKVPTEVDRLKAKQKQDLVLQKERDAQALLQARQRELAKKSREDINKISTGAKPRAITK
jgi:hypothetical protein